MTTSADCATGPAEDGQDEPDDEQDDPDNHEHMSEGKCLSLIHI